MCIGNMFLARAIAHNENKRPFFFSRFTFARMRERGNTHYCFYCLSGVGFKIDSTGQIADHLEGEYNGMKHHNPETHAIAVIGDADKFDSPWAWINAKIGKDFPLIVTIPSV